MTTERLNQLTVTVESSEDSRDDGLAADISQFVTFLVGEEVFAVEMAPVQEIIRVPEVLRVPLAPAIIEGLANLRGKVLPIISLRRIFNFPEQAHDESTRAVVVDLGQPLGFVVDRVSSVVGVEAGKIEDIGSIRSSVDTNLLSGLIKDVNGHAMIMVLNFHKIIQQELAEISDGSKKEALTDALPGTMDQEKGDERTSDELQLVSFDVAEQEYAIAIEDVQEIVQIPETIIHVPRSESHVIGVMTLRSKLLPLVSLRRMFHLPDQALDEKSRIVVLALGNASVGVAVDGVSEVLRVAKTDVDAMPAMLARDGDLSDISEICRLDNGKRLVSIITIRNLFDHSAIKEALNTVNDMDQEIDKETADQDNDQDDDEQVVVFRLDKEEFGAPIKSVQEIVRVPDELIRVPNTPMFVEGVINLRGSVLPVIDLRLRLGLSKAERSDRQRIMVFLLDGVRSGFIVDHVAEVLRIPKAAIEPAPKLSSKQGSLLSRMANLEKLKRMVQLIEPKNLVGCEELSELSTVADTERQNTLSVSTEDGCDQAIDS
ncbi:MAG: chemotaxis protein CheW [Planctomycetota bacterium]